MTKPYKWINKNPNIEMLQEPTRLCNLPKNNTLNLAQDFKIPVMLEMDCAHVWVDAGEEKNDKICKVCGLRAMQALLYFKEGLK